MMTIHQTKKKITSKRVGRLGHKLIINATPSGPKTMRNERLEPHIRHLKFKTCIWKTALKSSNFDNQHGLYPETQTIVIWKNGSSRATVLIFTNPRGQLRNNRSHPNIKRRRLVYLNLSSLPEGRCLIWHTHLGAGWNTQWEQKLASAFMLSLCHTLEHKYLLDKTFHIHLVPWFSGFGLEPLHHQALEARGTCIPGPMGL